MPINERGELVCDRSVESSGTVPPGTYPRQTPPPERSGRREGRIGARACTTWVRQALTMIRGSEQEGIPWPSTNGENSSGNVPLERRPPLRRRHIGLLFRPDRILQRRPARAVPSWSSH